MSTAQRVLEKRFRELYEFTLEAGPNIGTRAMSGDVWSKEDASAPFFSEAFLYTLLGKEDARSVLGLIHRLAEASGVDVYSLRLPADRTVRNGPERAPSAGCIVEYETHYTLNPERDYESIVHQSANIVGIRACCHTLEVLSKRLGVIELCDFDDPVVIALRLSSDRWTITRCPFCEQPIECVESALRYYVPSKIRYRTDQVSFTKFVELGVEAHRDQLTRRKFPIKSRPLTPEEFAKKCAVRSVPGRSPKV